MHIRTNGYVIQDHTKNLSIRLLGPLLADCEGLCASQTPVIVIARRWDRPTKQVDMVGKPTSSR